MRGCRGGDSPCAGLGGSPAFPIQSSKFPGGMHRIPRWKRQIRHSRIAAAASDRPCRAQRCEPPPTSLRSATFPRGEGFGAWLPRWERQVRAMPGERTSSDLAALGHLPQRGRLRQCSSPGVETADLRNAIGTNLIRPRCRSATFPKGEGLPPVVPPDMRSVFPARKKARKKPRTPLQFRRMSDIIRNWHILALHSDAPP